MNQAAQDRVYYPALDGLRGFAILLVLFHHNFDFVSLSRLCWVGVDLFFVLSGFLITDILLKTKGNKNFLQIFYLRRVLRIFPLYYLALLAFFILAPYCTQLKEQYFYYYNNQFFFWIYLQNWSPIFHNPTFADNSILGHFWSLSVEEQFYILWPFIILVCRNPKTLVRICLLLVLGSILFRFASWVYFGTSDLSYRLQYNTRMDGLCIGSLIAIWKHNKENIKNKMLKLGSVVISFHLFIALLCKTIFNNIPHFSFLGYTSISALFGILIVLGIEKKNILIKTIFGYKPIRYIGKISYGLYIFHIPVLVLLKIYLKDSFLKSGLSPLYTNFIISSSAVIIAILISIISFNLIEKKILLLKEKITAEGFSSFLRNTVLVRWKPVSAK